MAEQEVIVPVQPDISQLRGHRQQLVAWNPYACKNQALCYQFRTGEGPCRVKVYPDACVDFLIKCDPGSPSLTINGMQTSATTLELEGDSVYFGFKPYSVNGMRPADFTWSELTDKSLTLENLAGGGSQRRSSSSSPRSMTSMSAPRPSAPSPATI